MSGIFPNSGDGGVACNVATPPGHCPVTIPKTNPLYYGNGCDVRLRPEVINSLISEVAATADQAKVAYDPSRLTNLETSIRYLIQRGEPCGAAAIGGPNNYTVALDPAAAFYNDFMTLVVVPNTTNNGAVWLNTNGLGPVRVLRNDAQDLQYDDFRAGIPMIISYRNGYWWLLSLARSQVPLIVTGAIDCWIRTDGNDITGDGTTNTTERAFRTINGAWNRVGTRYASTPLLQINLRLGIPGTYESGSLTGFGGNVALIGDPGLPASYKVKASYVPGSISHCLASRVGYLNCQGVTFYIDAPGGSTYAVGLYCEAPIVVDRCRFEMGVANPETAMAYAVGGAAQLNFVNNVIFEGNNQQVRAPIDSAYGAWISGPSSPFSAQLNFNNMVLTQAGLMVHALAKFSVLNSIIVSTNVTGPKYLVTENALIQMGGQQPPGSTPGSSSLNGLFVP